MLRSHYRATWQQVNYRALQKVHIWANHSRLQQTVLKIHKAFRASSCVELGVPLSSFSPFLLPACLLLATEGLSSLTRGCTVC